MERDFAYAGLVDHFMRFEEGKAKFAKVGAAACGWLGGGGMGALVSRRRRDWGPACKVLSAPSRTLEACTPSGPAQCRVASIVQVGAGSRPPTASASLCTPSRHSARAPEKPPLPPSWVRACAWQEHGPYTYLAFAAVSPDFQRQGVGKLLMDAVTADADAKGGHGAGTGRQGSLDCRTCGCSASDTDRQMWQHKCKLTVCTPAASCALRLRAERMARPNEKTRSILNPFWPQASTSMWKRAQREAGDSMRGTGSSTCTRSWWVGGCSLGPATCRGDASWQTLRHFLACWKPLREWVPQASRLPAS